MSFSCSTIESPQLELGSFGLLMLSSIILEPLSISLNGRPHSSRSRWTGDSGAQTASKMAAPLRGIYHYSPLGAGTQSCFALSLEPNWAILHRQPEDCSSPGAEVSQALRQSPGSRDPDLCGEASGSLVHYKVDLGQ
jgi:hypothetical protein